MNFAATGYAPSNQAAVTIAQFCSAHGLGRTSFYHLVKQGKAPRLMKVGRRTLISSEAAADWRRDMERATAEAAQAGA